MPETRSLAVDVRERAAAEELDTVSWKLYRRSLEGSGKFVSWYGHPRPKETPKLLLDVFGRVSPLDRVFVPSNASEYNKQLTSRAVTKILPPEAGSSRAKSSAHCRSFRVVAEAVIRCVLGFSTLVIHDKTWQRTEILWAKIYRGLVPECSQASKGESLDETLVLAW